MSQKIIALISISVKLIDAFGRFQYCNAGTTSKLIEWDGTSKVPEELEEILSPFDIDFNVMDALSKARTLDFEHDGGTFGTTGTSVNLILIGE